MGSTTVGLEIDRIFSEVGSPDLLHAFFSTISVHLEPRGWGSRFPELMNQLYQGTLEPTNAETALRDARSIKEALAKLPAAHAVWDIADRAATSPLAESMNKAATSLANYHRTSTNRVLMDVLIECLEFQTQCKQKLSVLTLDQFLKQI